MPITPCVRCRHFHESACTSPSSHVALALIRAVFSSEHCSFPWLFIFLFRFERAPAELLFFLCRVWQCSRQLPRLRIPRVLQPSHTARADRAPQPDLLLRHMDTALLTGAKHLLITQRASDARRAVPVCSHAHRARATSPLPARLAGRTVTRTPVNLLGALPKQRTSLLVVGRVAGYLLLDASWIGGQMEQRETPSPSSWTRQWELS